MTRSERSWQERRDRRNQGNIIGHATLIISSIRKATASSTNDDTSKMSNTQAGNSFWGKKGVNGSKTDWLSAAAYRSTKRQSLPSTHRAISSTHSIPQFANLILMVTPAYPPYNTQALRTSYTCQETGLTYIHVVLKVCAGSVTSSSIPYSTWINCLSKVSVSMTTTRSIVTLVFQLNKPISSYQLPPVVPQSFMNRPHQHKTSSTLAHILISQATRLESTHSADGFCNACGGGSI